MKSPNALYSRLALLTSVTLVVGYFVVYAAWTSISDVTGGQTLTATLINNILGNLTDLNTRAWNLNGASSYYNGGNVGIGTNSPGNKLDIKSDGDGKNSISIQDILGNARVQIYDGASPDSFRIFMKNVAGTTNVAIADSDVSYFNGGNVGIGTTTPGAKLQVNTATNGVWAGYFVNTASLNSSYGLLIDAGTSSADGGFYVRDSTGATPHFIVRGNGYVGIGTTTPQTKLDVNGPVKILRSDAAPFACDSTKVGSIYLDSDAGGSDVFCVCSYYGGAYGWKTLNSTACD